MQHFRATTLGKTVVFGIKTYESIGKPLPHRDNIVLTRRENVSIPGVKVYNDYKKLIHDYKDKDLYICGGSAIYVLFQPYADEYIISYIKGTYEADTYVTNMHLEDFNLIKEDNTNELFSIKWYKCKKKNS
jgi:dihydrofolate reductase